MKHPQHHVRFPVTEPHQLDQDESYFLLVEDGTERRLRFHDYRQIYQRPGLYEQLFYQRLKCGSPKRVADILSKVLRDNREEMSELRVLDLGAGNGMFGEQLQSMGVARVIGVDICREAGMACDRDRPGVYDAYFVRDLCELDAETQRELAEWQIDCLSCVAALGFGDIPARAFANAFNLVAASGWIAFNIKESFLLESDTSGFSRLIKSLLVNDALEVHHLERYRHRISIDGRPLFYYALVGRKESDIPNRIMDSLGDTVA
ncbi:MAG: class I SAM-dependent methyltransferase [Planctomycetota bacterium]